MQFRLSVEAACRRALSVSDIGRRRGAPAGLGISGSGDPSRRATARPFSVRAQPVPPSTDRDSGPNPTVAVVNEACARERERWNCGASCGSRSPRAGGRQAKSCRWNVNIDWAGRCVRLDANTTRNGEARSLPFTADIEMVAYRRSLFGSNTAHCVSLSIECSM